MVQKVAVLQLSLLKQCSPSFLSFCVTAAQAAQCTQAGAAKASDIVKDRSVVYLYIVAPQVVTRLCAQMLACIVAYAHVNL
jgi:hypothetical protein